MGNVFHLSDRDVWEKTEVDNLFRSIQCHDITCQIIQGLTNNIGKSVAIKRNGCVLEVYDMTMPDGILVPVIRKHSIPGSSASFDWICVVSREYLIASSLNDAMGVSLEPVIIPKKYNKSNFSEFMSGHRMTPSQAMQEVFSLWRKGKQ